MTEYPYSVASKYPHLIVVPEISQTYNDYFIWLHDNHICRFTYTRGLQSMYFAFSSEEDKVLFALRWA